MDNSLTITVGSWVHSLVPSTKWGVGGWLHTTMGDGSQLITVFGGKKTSVINGSRRCQGWHFAYDDVMELYSASVLCGNDCEGDSNHHFIFNPDEIPETIEGLSEGIAMSLRDFKEGE